ncbi:hypothetical protein ACIBH1_45335 [Nonomuraea sp. NPDC050663]|uniref:hypothetical protein n=1 Tax=Nonomuraea sp. NPDC050663 TaxID=3364370 RepID=UPI0037AD7902
MRFFRFIIQCASWLVATRQRRIILALVAAAVLGVLVPNDRVASAAAVVAVVAVIIELLFPGRGNSKGAAEVDERDDQAVEERHEDPDQDGEEPPKLAA